MSPRSRTIVSAAESYLDAATAILRSVFPGAEVERLGPDVACLDAQGVGIAAVVEACRHHPIPFIRHLMREEHRLPFTDGLGDVDRVLDAVGELLGRHRDRPSLALQLWASGVSPAGYRLEYLRHRVADRLAERGVEVARANRERVLSVCATPRGIVVGTNPRRDALSDWPGGRVRLANRDGRISRAEFKLEELFGAGDLALPAAGIALDLGASPDGWTRLLRLRGLTVWAIDPAPLDPRLAADPGVHHVPTTAGRFLATTGRSFDLVVNDMRMPPKLSSELMLTAADRLVPNGFAVQTLKISPQDAVTTVNAALTILRRRYAIERARQLHHNRDEVTVVMRRAAGGGPPRKSR